MTITIIGAGNIGGTLAEKWKAAGHSILIGARNPSDEETLKWAAGSDARAHRGCRSTRRRRPDRHAGESGR
ncbi:MAG: NAD(P)-binding domain-containing protein [Flavobacteriales bacterium]|nr:NAD(P)-binding domain-containing protein [Flavobacteriales bacterium]